MLIDALVNVQTSGVSFSLNEHIIRRFKGESLQTTNLADDDNQAHNNQQNMDTN